MNARDCVGHTAKVGIKQTSLLCTAQGFKCPSCSCPAVVRWRAGDVTYALKASPEKERRHLCLCLEPAERGGNCSGCWGDRALVKPSAQRSDPGFGTESMGREGEGLDLKLILSCILHSLFI